MYGLPAVALFVVPDTETVAPSPLGQGAGVGRLMVWALLQLSLAGCAKIIEGNNNKGNKVYNAFKR